MIIRLEHTLKETKKNTSLYIYKILKALSSTFTEIILITLRAATCGAFNTQAAILSFPFEGPLNNWHFVNIIIKS